MRNVSLRPTVVGLMRSAKHHLSRISRPLASWTEDRFIDARASLVPFEWNDEAFAQSHAGRALPADPHFDPTAPVRRVIWGVWSGSNPMSANRQSGWDEVERLNAGTECVLVQPKSLGDIEIPGYPIHPAYEHLSLEHRSDYLRAYLMHLHGGGYTDIKAATHSWRPFFDRLDASNAWALGYPETGSLWVADLPRPIRDLPKRYHGLLIADGAFIMRPRSPLTALWFDEVHRRLDYYADDLRRFPGPSQAEHHRYPIRWTGLLGDINGAILLRYHAHLIQEPKIRPRMTNYR